MIDEIEADYKRVDFDEEHMRVFESFNVADTDEEAGNYFDNRLFDDFQIYRDYRYHI